MSVFRKFKRHHFPFFLTQTRLATTISQSIGRSQTSGRTTETFTRDKPRRKTGRERASSNTNGRTTIIIAKNRIALHGATIPSPAKNVLTIGIGRRNLNHRPIRTCISIRAARPACTSMLVGHITGVPKGHDGMRGTIHALIARHKTETHKAAAMVVLGPDHRHVLGARIDGRLLTAVELPAIGGDARAGAVVVGRVRGAAETTFALVERLEVALGAEQEAVRGDARRRAEQEAAEDEQLRFAMRHCAFGLWCFTGTVRSSRRVRSYTWVVVDDGSRLQRWSRSGWKFHVGACDDCVVWSWKLEWFSYCVA